MKFTINNNKEEKKVKAIRFSKELNERIEKEAKMNKVSFSKFVVEACLFALNNMEEKEVNNCK